MKNFKLVEVIKIVLSIAMIVGQVKCIVKAVNCNWEPIGKAEVIYTVAACTGAGVVVGFIDIKDN